VLVLTFFSFLSVFICVLFLLFFHSFRFYLCTMCTIFIIIIIKIIIILPRGLSEQYFIQSRLGGKATDLHAASLSSTPTGTTSHWKGLRPILIPCVSKGPISHGGHVRDLQQFGRLCDHTVQASSRAEVKEGRKWIYIAPLLKYLTLKALTYGSHSVTCKLHRTCLYLVSIHQMAHPQTEVADI